MQSEATLSFCDFFKVSSNFFLKFRCWSRYSRIVFSISWEVSFDNVRCSKPTSIVSETAGKILHNEIPQMSDLL